MSLTEVVTAQFQHILYEKCNCGYGSMNCVDKLNRNLSAQCVFHLLTAILGYILIGAVAAGELPVLYKVLKLQSKKADIGTIQVSSLVFTSSNFVAYAVNKNLPVSTWGEGILLLTLHVIIANLLCLNSGRHRYAVVFMVLYVIVMVVLLWPLVSDQVLSGLMLLNIPINIFRKSRRVFNNQSQKGETRFPSRRFILLTNFCSLGRLLTTMADTTDLLFHTYSIVDCALNIILALVTISSWIKRNKLSKNRASPAG